MPYLIISYSIRWAGVAIRVNSDDSSMLALTSEGMRKLVGSIVACRCMSDCSEDLLTQFQAR